MAFRILRFGAECCRQLALQINFVFVLAANHNFLIKQVSSHLLLSSENAVNLHSGLGLEKSGFLLSSKKSTFKIH